jgi:hypothetical protein
MGDTVAARLRELGIVLPEPATPGGNYVPAKTVGRVVYLAGAISRDADGVITGTVGLDRSIEEGYAAARACALTQLAALERHLGLTGCSEKYCGRKRIRERGGGIRGFAKGDQRRVGPFGGSTRRSGPACARGNRGFRVAAECVSGVADHGGDLGSASTRGRVGREKASGRKA